MSDQEAIERINAGLEQSLEVLALVAEYAAVIGRPQFGQSVTALLRQIEDLRQRTEEFDPAQLDPQYPSIIRAAGQPRATRIAIALDSSSAIYKRLDGSMGPWRTPYFRIHPYAPGSVVARIRESQAVDLRALPDPDKYAFDAPEELEATAPRSTR